MSIHQRVPGAPLNEYIEWLWYFDEYYPDHDRQHVLPEGSFELIINLEERKRKLFDHHNPNRHQIFKRGWISGPHREYMIIDALPGSTMIGAHFKPGGAAPFLGFPAGVLFDQVVELDAIWGESCWEWRDRLLEAKRPETKLALLERLLLRKLAEAGAGRERPRSVTWAVERFVREPQVQTIQSVTGQMGISHKHFIEQFRCEVGLTPKLFCRIRRFQRVLRQIHARKAVSWADVAYSCGYFDQAHFVNDFVGFAGVNPTAYLRQQLEGDPNYIRAKA